MPEVIINYWAILACGIASMVLGFLWYGPLFGKTWVTLMGWDPSNTAAMEAKKKEATKAYAVQFIGSLLIAYTLAHSLTFAMSYLKIDGVNAALQGGFWNWLGFIAPVTVGSVLWEGKSWKLWCLNNTYYLVLLCVMGLILVSWK